MPASTDFNMTPRFQRLLDTTIARHYDNEPHMAILLKGL